MPIEQARLGENPAGPDEDTFSPDEEVVCSFKPDFVSGSTPKFDCERSNGKKIKVKYGRDNAEIYAEVVASRLLTALGFPADRMYVVKRVRCFGCPPDPFEGLQCLNEGEPVESCFSNLDYTKSDDFDYAVIERRLKGAELETKKVRGWGWDELSKIDPAAGGASRAQVDALRLLAVFLNHWDNKPKNQRVLCWTRRNPPTGTLPECRHPVAMVQDLGASFGPDKFNLDNWAKTPIWDDAATCGVSMRASAVRRIELSRHSYFRSGTAVSRGPSREALEPPAQRAVRRRAGFTLSAGERGRKGRRSVGSRFRSEGARHRRSRALSGHPLNDSASTADGLHGRAGSGC